MERQAGSLSSTKLQSSGATRRRVRLPAVGANAADHAPTYFFLQSVFQCLSAAEFQASLDDPFYEPHDRLLLRQWRRIVAHVHVSHRTMHFGPTTIPIASLGWLGVAAEYRGQGLGAHLLRAAEVRMEADGVLLGVLRTSIPRFFRHAGWAVCAAAGYHRVDACALLAQLLDRRMIPRRRRFHVRPLLRWEYPALARIYAQNVLQSQFHPATGTDSSEPEHGPEFRRGPIVGCTAHGPLERTEAYWKWLLDRRAYDQLYVALEGPELLDMDETCTRVVGYAATRGEQILELMVAPDRPRAAVELLARCCGEAIEHGRRCVLLHAPPSSPLFRVFDDADGVGHPETSEHGETSMIRLLNPLGLLRRLCGEFDRRAVGACLPRPLDLGLLVEGRKYQLKLGREGVLASSRRVGRSYLRLSEVDFTRLVLGQLDWDAAVAEGRLECSTSLAHDAGCALFPQLPFWRPPWDDLPAE